MVDIFILLVVLAIILLHQELINLSRSGSCCGGGSQIVQKLPEGLENLSWEENNVHQRYALNALSIGPSRMPSTAYPGRIAR
jgi:hypothetical protein